MVAAFLTKLKVAINEELSWGKVEFPKGKDIKNGGSNTMGIRPFCPL